MKSRSVVPFLAVGLLVPCLWLAALYLKLPFAHSTGGNLAMLLTWPSSMLLMVPDAYANTLLVCFSVALNTGFYALLGTLASLGKHRRTGVLAAAGFFLAVEGTLAAWVLGLFGPAQG